MDRGMEIMHVKDHGRGRVDVVERQDIGITAFGE